MNLALVISSLSAGGAERVMSELANCWAARGESITLVTLDSAESDGYALLPSVRRVALGLRTDSYGVRAALVSNYRRIRALRSALLASGAQTVVSFEAHTSVLVLLATSWSRLRRVVSERVNPTEHYIGTTWSILRRLTYPLADVLVVQTKVAVPWAESIMLGRQVEVISNPVRDMRDYMQDREAVRSHTIVAVGRLARQKGFDLLLQAFARIADTRPSWDLVIIGEGEERAPLERLATSLRIDQRVKLPGWRPEPAEVLKTAGLFVMSSRYEGFPNALIEAMACGVPVVSTMWAGAAEIITDGVDGLLSRKDPEHLAAVMRRAIDDAGLREQLGRNALLVTERYRLGSVIEQWDAVIAAPCEQTADLKSCS